MTDNILSIANRFIETTNLKPHLNCIIATRMLLAELRKLGISAEWVTYFVAIEHYNGSWEDGWSDQDDLEHHCIRINNQILDVTSSQFNCHQGQTLPLILFGEKPSIYKEEY